MSHDAVIVGGGIVGAACAYYLTREGVRVLVLERDFVGSGTTSAGMGHIVAMDDSVEQLALTAYSQRLWRELFSELSPESEVDRCGTLWIAEDDEEMAAVVAKRDAYAASGIAAEVLDEAALAGCEPNLRRGLAGALRVADDSVLYPPAAAQWFLARAVEGGAVLREHARVTAVTGDRVRLDAEEIGADVVIVAAGTETARLSPGLPITPRKGHLAITGRYPGLCRHQLVELGYLNSAHGMTSESVAFNVQPRLTGQLLIGSSRELVGWDASLNRRILGEMMRRAADFIPRLPELSVLRVWTGFRPATPDKLPLVGRWDRPGGPWIAAGHEGLGITTSVGTGMILTDLILGRSPAIDPTAFSPDRAAGPVGSTA
jgi:glycine/D-amino acid oxidase-like deaminating enzyme